MSIGTTPIRMEDIELSSAIILPGDLFAIRLAA